MCFKWQMFNIKAAAITPDNSLIRKAKNSKIVVFPNKIFALTWVVPASQLRSQKAKRLLKLGVCNADIWMTLRTHLNSFQFNTFEWSRAELCVCKSQHTHTHNLQMTLSVLRVRGMAKCLHQYPPTICLQRAPPYDTIPERSTVVIFSPRTMTTCRLMHVQLHAVRLLPRNIKKYNFAFCFRRVWLLVCHIERGT